jgi:hypothetical protein
VGELVGADQAGAPLVKVSLVPVEVFGAECRTCDTEVGYGLSDAVSPWSDCNRAVGHIYRRDEGDTPRDPAEVITVYVPQAEVAKFEQRFGED